jgi:hypothetical protein
MVVNLFRPIVKATGFSTYELYEKIIRRRSKLIIEE